MKTPWFKKYSLDWPVPLHVILLAAFPVLFLYAYNINRMGTAELIEQWRREYNQFRPHSAKNYRPPAPVAVLIGVTK